MSSSSSVKYSLEITVLIFERLNLHYYGIIIILVENCLKTAILSLIAIISGTIYHPAKCVMTGLSRGDFFHGCFVNVGPHRIFPRIYLALIFQP